MRRGLAGILFVAVATLFVVACGDGGSPAKPAPTSASNASSHADALTRSSAKVAKANSFSATFHANVQTGGKTVLEDGTMAGRGSTFDMKMNVAGQQTEILAAPPDEYINMPGKGWYSMGDAVFNQQGFAQYAKNRGPIDYSGIVGSLQSSRQLADDTIDGKTYAHFTGTFDIKKAIASIPGDVFKPGVADTIDSFNPSPGALDVWLDTSTGLPRRVTEKMSMTVFGSKTVVDMTVDYTSWNGNVDIMPIPQDAKPYSDLSGGLSVDELAYDMKFANWMAGVLNHMQTMSHFASNNSTLTAEQQATWNKLVTDFQNDVAALKAMNAPARFKPSYDEFAQAMDTFSVVIDEATKDFASPGSGNEQRATDAEASFEKQFSDAADLFKSESSATAANGSPTPQPSP